MPSSRPSVPPSSFSPTAPPYTALYLALYNLLSASLWLTILLRTLSTPFLSSSSSSNTSSPPTSSLGSSLFKSTYPLLQWTQTLALLELLHSATALVRSPLFTAGMQIASRLLLVWGILFFTPEVITRQPPSGVGGAAYGAMLAAWAVTEVLRYGYYALAQLRTLGVGVGVPKGLVWARYNAFLGLYPLGIVGECALIWRAAGVWRGRGEAVVEWGLYGILGLYVPGEYESGEHWRWGMG